MRAIVNGRMAFWLLLAVPAVWMLGELAIDAAGIPDLVPQTGLTSARLMIAAMAIGPLADLAGPRPWTRWLLARRRYLGVAAFLYALPHLAFYCVDMGTLRLVIRDVGVRGIWPGWAALVLMLAPALTSTDRAMRAMRRGWKWVQRAAYPAALLTLLHWRRLDLQWGPALLHFAPLAALLLARWIKRFGVFA